MSFHDLAHAAEDIATALASNFVATVPEHATDITSVVSELFAISTALRSLGASHGVPALRANFARIAEDVELVVRASLRQTLRDVFDALTRLNHSDGGVAAAATAAAGVLDPAAHRATWISLWAFFQRQAGFTLVLRVRYYRAMLGEMVAIARGEVGDEVVLSRHREAVNALRLVQDRQTAGNNNNGSNSRRHTSTPTQSTTPTPPPPRPHSQPSPAAGAAVPPHRRDIPLKSAMRKSNPTSPTSPAQPAPWEPLNGAGFDKRASTAQSPTQLPGSRGSSMDAFGSLSSPTSSSDSAPSSPDHEDIDHWGVKAFHPPPVSTPLSRTGPPTRCYGHHMSGVKARLRAEYNKLFQLDFPGSPLLSVSFHLRSSDHRTRILCAVQGANNGHTQYSTLPITCLTIAREGSCLKLFQKTSQSKDVELWATLQFRSVERLVAFHCAFLAFRGQDASNPVANIKDAELNGEIQIYGGQIVDDDFLHALRIFRDSDSKAVRLIASVHKGELDRVPVWNAFVHRHMRSSSWMRKMGPRMLYLSKLQRTIYIDSSEYQPEVTADGYHVITFASETDLNSFVYCVNNLLDHTRTF